MLSFNRIGSTLNLPPPLYVNAKIGALFELEFLRNVHGNPTVRAGFLTVMYEREPRGVKLSTLTFTRNVLHNKTNCTVIPKSFSGHINVFNWSSNLLVRLCRFIYNAQYFAGLISFFYLVVFINDPINNTVCVHQGNVVSHYRRYRD